MDYDQCALEQAKLFLKKLLLSEADNTGYLRNTVNRSVELAVANRTVN